MLYLRLFLEFFRAGLFAVGGGLATVPFLFDMGARTGWFTDVDVTNMIAVAEATPGPLGVNMATYVGFSLAGVPGCIVATLGLIAPSYLCILLVARMLRRFRGSRLVEGAFYGLRPASTALIAAAGLGVASLALLRVEAYQSSGLLSRLVDWRCLLLAGALLAATRLWTRVHPILWIALSAAVGILLRL